MREGQIGEGMIFSSVDEVEHAIEAGAVNMHSRITAKVEQIDSEGATFFKRCETTPGRLRLGAVSYTHLRAHETPEHLV